MKHSKIKEHAFVDKELVPPFLKGEMGTLIQLHSWSKERLPEYVWIGLLRISCDTRKDYFDKMGYLKEYILKNFEENIAKISTILKLDSKDKNKLFNEIKRIFGENVLDPLLIVSYFDDELRKVFQNRKNTNDNRLDQIKNVTEKMYDRYSEVAMDVRYMVIIFGLNKIRFLQDQVPGMIEAISKYPTIEYNSPEMNMYSCELSSFEGMDFGLTKNYDYSKYFYEEMYLMTDCNPLILSYNGEKCDDELKNCIQKVREFLIKYEEIKYNDKHDVIVGNLSYIYKIVSEIYNNNLGASIISRLAMRTLVEVYCNLKFICENSVKEPKIWESFKDYGSGKYKIIYKRIEEGSANAEECVHLNDKLIKILTNENKCEEFLKVKFSNFADKNVRQKFIDIKEKNLYDTYYDYDTCFSHGYWSAIRESSLLLCDNPLHNYHSVADLNFEQKLPNIYRDYIYILEKIINIIEKEIGVE